MTDSEGKQGLKKDSKALEESKALPEKKKERETKKK